ncbi:MAG: transporter [Alphaproteobacteria bacterium]|nr:transporter [Alphaproteobacteria bacterium]
MKKRQESRQAWRATLIGSAALMALLFGTSVLAADEKADTSQVTSQDLQKLLDIVARQNQKLEQQQKLLSNQTRRLEQLEKQVRVRPGSAGPKRAVYRPSAGTQGGSQTRRAAEQQKKQPAQSQQGTPQKPVGEDLKKKEQQDRRELAGVYEAGGVLTTPGTLVIEPSVEYSQSNINRFFFQGLEIVDTVLIGQIEATDSDRDSIIGRATFRTGITNRSEAEIRIPYVYRDDRVTSQVVGATSTSQTNSLDGNGIGDVEGSVRYQINSGQEGWPIFVGAVRAKSDTGRGPFEVSRDANGIETELARGSGFWGVEPGLTMLFGTDPAVFFANTKYLFHLERNVDKVIAGQRIGDVDPGDVLSISFGMGIGLNERTSISLGYEHNFIWETETERDGVTFRSQDLDVGSLLVGYSYAISPQVSINLSVQAGVTENAPDVVMTLRVPWKFNVF